MDYADLAVIDLSKAASETGRIELAQQIRGALKTAGFFYVVNHGLSTSQASPSSLSLNIHDLNANLRLGAFSI